jgi:hypothetical protein
MIGTSTDNPRLRASLIVLDGDGVLTNILEPDVLERAVSVAVNTFGLVLADDGVFESGSGAEDEDSVGLT